jgi:hypothetical protein
LITDHTNKTSNTHNTNNTKNSNSKNSNSKNSISTPNNSSSNKSNEINIKDVISKRKNLLKKQIEKNNKDKEKHLYEKLNEKIKEKLSEKMFMSEKFNTNNNSTKNFKEMTPRNMAIKMRLENLSEVTNAVLNKNFHLESSDELLDIVSEYENVNKTENGNENRNHNFSNIKSLSNLNTLNSLGNSSNVKITNITNIILGPKSFDINMKSHQKNTDTMMRDVKNNLHLITQKALSTHSKHNPIDSIDDERKSFFNFHNLSSKKALFIDDNSDLPVGIGKDSRDMSNYKDISKVDEKENPSHHNCSNSFTFSNNSETLNRQKQIINIININNNYNIGSINMPNIENKTKNVNVNNNYYSLGTNGPNLGPNFNKSFRTMSINNYKKNISHIGDQSVSMGNNMTMNNCETPNIETTRSNNSNKLLRKLIPRNSNSNSTLKEYMSNMSGCGNGSSGNLNGMINPHLNNKSIKDIIRSVKKDNGKGKFVNLANK